MFWGGLGCFNGPNWEEFSKGGEVNVGGGWGGGSRGRC